MLTAGLPISLLSFYALSIYSEDICWATSVPFTLVSRMKKRKLKDHPAHWGATMAEVLDTMVIRPSFRTVGLQYDMPRVCARGFPLSPDFLPPGSTSWRSHYSQQCHKPGTRLLTSKPFRFLGLTTMSLFSLVCPKSKFIVIVCLQRHYGCSSFVCGLILDG